MYFSQNSKIFASPFEKPDEIPLSGPSKQDETEFVDKYVNQTLQNVIIQCEFRLGLHRSKGFFWRFWKSVD